VSSDQQGVLTEKYHRYSLIIGGINIFLPISLVEANAHIESTPTTEKGQPTVTVMMKEKIIMSSPAEEEENEIKVLTPWEKDLEMLEDWLNN
jgi:hypothetical protein